MFATDKKKKRPNGRFSFTRRVAVILSLIALALWVAPIALDYFFPFAPEPSVTLDFQKNGDELLSLLHKETNCFPAYNNEKQCYMEENVSIEPEGLVLRAVYEGQTAEGEPFITSGRVDTRNFFHQSCGKYEIVGKFPSGVGVFAAIWLREPEWKQTNTSLPNPAINIAEYQGGMTNFLHFNLHTNQSLAREDSKTWSKSVEISNLPDTFHTFTVEWQPQKITFLVDGVTHSTLENTGDWIEGPAHMIWNLAMGGTWAEAVAARQGLETWHGIQLNYVGQQWEMVIQSMRYYPLRNPARCS